MKIREMFAEFKSAPAHRSGLRPDNGTSSKKDNESKIIKDLLQDLHREEGNQHNANSLGGGTCPKLPALLGRRGVGEGRQKQTAHRQRKKTRQLQL
jgi:hypothetical protein